MKKEINYTLEKSDYKKVAKDCLSVERYKRARLTISLIFVIIVLLSVICYGITVHENFYRASITLLYVVIMTLLPTYFGYEYILAQNIKHTSKGANLDYNIVFDDEMDFFVAKNASGETKYNWNSIKDIYNLKNTIMIFPSDYMSITIPKRIFSSEEEINEVWNLIQNCYNKSRENV